MSPREILPISQIIENLQLHLPKISWWRVLDVYSAVEKLLVISSSLLLALSGVWGYSVYIGFMRKNPSTQKRLINVLSGQFALGEQLYGVTVFTAVVRDQMGLDEDSALFEILLQVRSFLILYIGIIQFLIAAMTVLKKFYPDDYLTMSENWTLKSSMKDILIIIVIQGVLTGTCFLTSNDKRDFRERVALTYGLVSMIILILTIAIQIKVVMVENKKTIQLKMNKLIRQNAVAPANGTLDEVDEEEATDNEEKVKN